MPTVALLLPWRNPSFLGDQITDLLRSPGVFTVTPGRIPWGSVGKLPPILSRLLARFGAGRVRVRGQLRAVVIFHPWQLPLAEALISRHPDCELWYSRWDRYEFAFSDAYWDKPRLERRVGVLHARAVRNATLTIAVSDALAELDANSGGSSVVVPLPADSFPTSDLTGTIVAISLGYLGARTDWSLLRTVAEAMPDLVVLLVGAWDESLVRSDPDCAACRKLANVVWLGRRSDAEASRLILCADVGIVPYKLDPYNDAALPHRILKYARLGRRTIAPDLEGVRTLDSAVTRVQDLPAWIEALRRQRGTRASPDLELQSWALAQSAEVLDQPLWERIAALGVQAPSVSEPSSPSVLSGMSSP